MIKYSPPRYLLRRHTLLKNVKKGTHFLEVGAGNLMLSRDLSKHFKSGTCIDFAPKVKAIHKSLPEEIREKLTIMIGNFFDLDFDKTFDCIVSCEVMEHIEEDEAFLDKIHSLLKKNGQVIISVPAKQKYWTIHDDVVGHVRRYEKDQLHALFGAKKFKDIQVISYGFPFINALWALRKLHGMSQAGKKSSWSQEKQTKESGVGQLSKLFNPLGVISNKYVFYPLNKIASLFNRLNWSEGYLVVATKK